MNPPLTAEMNLSVEDPPKVSVARVHVRAGNPDTAGQVSQCVRPVLLARGIDPDIQRRAALVADEAETNAILLTTPLGMCESAGQLWETGLR